MIIYIHIWIYYYFIFVVLSLQIFIFLLYSILSGPIYSTLTIFPTDTQIGVETDVQIGSVFNRCRIFFYFCFAMYCFIWIFVLICFSLAIFISKLILVLFVKVYPTW